MHDSWSRAPEGLVEQFADRGREEFLGRARLFLLGVLGMRAAVAIRHFIGAIFSALLGGVFFFVIVGVFGVPSATVALLLFIALSLWIVRRPQGEEHPNGH